MSFRRSTFALLAATAFLAACDDDPITPDPELTLTVAPAALTIALGETGESDVTVVRDGTSAAVTVTVTGGGDGVTAAIEDVAHDGDETTATLVVTVAEDAEAGAYTVTVKADNADADEVTKAVAVTVTEE